jgi:hypothetical protein
MAGSYEPTVTVQAIPFVSFTTGDSTSYKEITQAQGSTEYKVESLYIRAKTVSQINQPITFVRYGANGDVVNTVEVNLADPSQFQPAKNINLSKNNIIFDGTMRMDVFVKSEETIDILFEVQKSDSSQFLKDGAPFFSEDFLKTHGFYKEYSDEIKNTVKEINKKFNGGNGK